MRATECQIVANTDGIVIKKDVLSTIFYAYDSEDRLSRKRIMFADGKEHVVYYETPDDSNTVAKFVIDEQTVTSHSKTDSFGRKVFDELQIGKGFVSRQFDYHIGEITEEHAEHGKIKSSPTTQLVDRIVLSDHHVLSYEYDKEERITKVTDSFEGQADDVTEYTYDALGQLRTETRNRVSVNVMTYDKYGNISTKNGVVYGYEVCGWKDRLVSVGDQTITYDAQGNPTTYLGKTLTWEKGRQLKSFGEHTYTYNANGIRTSKTVGTDTHEYTLDGTSILRETWGKNTLIPLYDNEESVCGIIYNDNPFYFLKNLQGDIIAIVVQEADVVARYSYDAWGVCTIVSDASQCSIANINPYRYRGYYYDAETKLYYLQSRYYDPETGRFVNRDNSIIVSLVHNSISSNMFAHCDNNAINNNAIDGHFTLKKVYKSIKKFISFDWNWISIKLSKEIAIVFAILVLIYRMCSVLANLSSIHKLVNNKFAAAIVAALPYGSAMISTEIIAWICNVGAAVAIFSVVISFITSCCTGGIFYVAKTASQFVISYLAPTIIAAVQMLYYATQKKKGCTYRINLFGGSSIKFN